MGVWLGEIEVFEPFASGGTGRVLRGRHARAGVAVAVKVLNEDYARVEAVRAAFGNEARAVAALNHPNIVRILDYGEVPEATQGASTGALTPGSPYLVMPLMTGGTAAALRSGLPWRSLLTLLLALLDALAHAHARGVLHRDIKPSNVLLGDPLDLAAGVVLADFGLARLEGARFPTARALRGAGTPGFLPPEQRSAGFGEEGPWSDLFSLGRLARVLSGGGRGGRWPEDGFQEWVRWLTHADPSLRPQSAAQAAEQLARLDVGAPTRPAWWREEQGPSSVDAAMSGAVVGMREPPMVGRRAQRDAGWAALVSVRRGGGLRVLSLEGPRGSGKSRLATWLADHADERDLAEPVRVPVEALSGGRELLAEGLRRLFGSRFAPADAGLHGAATRLREALNELRWDAASVARVVDAVFPERAPVEGAPVEGAPVEGAPGGASAGSLRRAWLELPRRLPLLLVLDDFHLEADAVEVLDSLALPAKPGGAGLLVVLTCASEALAQRPALRARLGALSTQGLVQRLALPPLSEAEQLELVHGLVGGTALRAQDVIDRAHGDPGFAVQLCRHVLIERGAKPSSTPPGELSELYRRDVERCAAAWTDAERDAVSLAALLGLEIEPSLWRGACAALGIPASSAPFEALARLGFVSTRSGQRRFSSGSLRAALVLIAEGSGRAPALHRACEVALPRRAAKRRAEHLLAAGDDARALAPLTEALRGAVAARRLQRAAAMEERWGELVERLGLVPTHPERLEGELALADLWQARGLVDAAWALSEDLIERAPSAPYRQRARRLAALCAWDQGRVPDYLTIARQIIADAVGAERAQAQLDLAYGLRMSGEHEAAARLATTAEASFAAAGDRRGGLQAQRFRLLDEARRHPSEEVLLAATELRRAAEELGLGETIAAMLVSEGELMRVLNHRQGAALLFEEAAARLERMGSAQALLPRINLGVVHLELGQPGRALQELDAALRVLRAYNLMVYEGYVLAWMSRAVGELERWEVVTEEWARADVSLAQLYGHELLPALRGAVEAARQAAPPAALDVLERLLVRCEEAAGARPPAPAGASTPTPTVRPE